MSQGTERRGRGEDPLSLSRVPPHLEGVGAFLGGGHELLPRGLPAARGQTLPASQSPGSSFGHSEPFFNVLQISVLQNENDLERGGGAIPHFCLLFWPPQQKSLALGNFMFSAQVSWLRRSKHPSKIALRLPHPLAHLCGPAGAPRQPQGASGCSSLNQLATGGGTAGSRASALGHPSRGQRLRQQTYGGAAPGWVDLQGEQALPERAHREAFPQKLLLAGGWWPVAGGWWPVAAFQARSPALPPPSP